MDNVVYLDKFRKPKKLSLDETIMRAEMLRDSPYHQYKGCYADCTQWDDVGGKVCNGCRHNLDGA